MSVKSGKNKHGLGRSFDSLIPTDLLDEAFDPTADQDQRVSELRYIKITDIKPDPNQPRRDFESSSLSDLAESIKEHGVLQPIIVTPFRGSYQIVAGERRYRASLMVGLEKIPAIIRTLSSQHKLELSLIENIQRKDLNPLEMATAYLKLKDQFNMTLDQIGQRVGGLSGAAITNKIRLLRLSDYVKKHIVEGDLNEGQARTLVGVDEDTIKIVVPKIIKESWSVRKIEQFVVDLKKNRADGVTSIKKQITNPYRQEIDNLSKSLKTEVKIHTNSKGAGHITIKFKNEDEFRRLESVLK